MNALIVRTGVTILLLLALLIPASAQEVLFDFDGAPIHSPLPIDVSAGGITAHLSASGLGYSIQEANTMGFTPQGFAGLCVYPSSINLADLFVRFDQPLVHFSILYACQELGCDDAATMRVTAYMAGLLVGTTTKSASAPGTWPSDTLGCTFPEGFDSVVVHYDARPPTCQDYGVIFMADNMRVTPKTGTGVPNPGGGLPGGFSLEQNYPNPFNPGTRIEYVLPASGVVSLKVFDVLGEEVSAVETAMQPAGRHVLEFDGSDLPDGVYFYRFSSGEYTATRKMLLMH
jgi:hypothetical protein